MVAFEVFVFEGGGWVSLLSGLLVEVLYFGGCWGDALFGGDLDVLLGGDEVGGGLDFDGFVEFAAFREEFGGVFAGVAEG